MWEWCHTIGRMSYNTTGVISHITERCHPKYMNEVTETPWEWCHNTNRVMSSRINVTSHKILGVTWHLTIAISYGKFEWCHTQCDVNICECCHTHNRCDVIHKNVNYVTKMWMVSDIPMGVFSHTNVSTITHTPLVWCHTDIEWGQTHKVCESTHQAGAVMDIWSGISKENECEFIHNN